MFYYFNAEMKYYEKPLPPTLNEATWDYIQQAAQDGTASDLWSVGDRKEIILNGTCRARTFDNYKIYAYILGFNHNAEEEGDKTITFQIGFDALENGNHIALCDSSYGTESGTRFCVNDASTNAGGWNSSLMRNTIIPEFISCLPSDLQSTLKAVNKYTDNGVGSTHKSSVDITTTQDKVFLLSEYEVFGSRSRANQYEKDYQVQYDYYKNGNSRIMYNDQNTGNAVFWWERSPYYNSPNGFCDVADGDYADFGGASYALGFAPAFVVG